MKGARLLRTARRAPSSYGARDVGRAPIRGIAAALVALTALIGTIVDDAPARPPVTRDIAGPDGSPGVSLRVLEVDLHAHTRFADGFLSPFDLVLQARRRGLDALAITDHNILFPALLGRWFGRVTSGPTILVGEEITTRDYHVHGVGLEERIDASLPLDRVIDEVHRQGGILIAAHPVKRFWPLLVPARSRFDAAEVMHPLAFGSRDGGWRWEEMRDYYEGNVGPLSPSGGRSVGTASPSGGRALADGKRLTAVASSDYHFFSPLGVTRTLVFAKSDSEADILAALREGKTVVHDLEGRPYGDPALIEALRKDPYPMRPQDYGYRGNGWIDRISRLIALAALAGLVLFGKRR